MLYCDRIDLNEEINSAKNNNSKKCIVCKNWLINGGFEFQNFICNCCHQACTQEF